MTLPQFITNHATGKCFFDTGLDKIAIVPHPLIEWQQYKNKTQPFGERETQMADQIKSPRVAQLLNSKLRALNMTRTDFIRKFHKTYGDTGSRNHLYKILNGSAVVGERGMLPMITDLLDIDLNEAVRAVRADKMTAKGWSQSIPKASKAAQEVAIIMERLGQRDQAELLQLAKMKAALN